MIDETGVSAEPSNIFLYDAERAELTGITDVLSFTESSIVTVCKYGILSVDGSKLKIENFDSKSGILSVTGEFYGFYYMEKEKREKRKKGAFSK